LDDDVSVGIGRDFKSASQVAKFGMDTAARLLWT